MSQDLIRWALGLTISLVAGHLATYFFLKAVRKAGGLGAKPGGEVPARVAPWMTGLLERFVFTILVAFSSAAAIGPMIGWLGLKLATNWNHPLWKDNADARTWGMTALLAGLMSMLFAFLGGLVARGDLRVGI